MEHEFTLILDNVTDLDEELENRLFESGCDDALVFSQAGVCGLDFTREAPSFLKAVCSAIEDVYKAGYRVKRIAPDDIASAAEIGRRLGKTRQFVYQRWNGERGESDFPVPVAGTTSKDFLWSWASVAEWALNKNLIHDETVYFAAKAVLALNYQLLHKEAGEAFSKEFKVKLPRYRN